MYFLYQLNMAILFPYNLYNSQFYEQLIIKVNCLPQKNEELSLRQLLFRLTDTLWQMKKYYRPCHFLFVTLITH